MNNNVKIKSIEELMEYYNFFFKRTISNRDKILYVGYENEDFLIQILAKTGADITAIDKEDRRTFNIPNIHCFKINFSEIEKVYKSEFDYVIFSFVLHENEVPLHKKFISIAKRISKNIILIEPLARKETQGMRFEKIVEKVYKQRGILKHYYDENYWKVITDFNIKKDICNVLDRSYQEIIYRIDEEILNVSIQNIIILICTNERYAYGENNRC